MNTWRRCRPLKKEKKKKLKLILSVWNCTSEKLFPRWNLDLQEFIIYFSVQHLFSDFQTRNVSIVVSIPIIIQLLNSYLINFFSILLLWVSSWPKYRLCQNERSHFEGGNSFMREWKPSSAFASLLSQILLKPSNFWVFGISLMVLRRRGAKWGSSLPPPPPPPPPPRPHIHSSFPLHFTSGPHPTRVHKAGSEGSHSHLLGKKAQAVPCLVRFLPGWSWCWVWRRASYSLRQQSDGRHW